jgi:hypothetical protein
VAPATGEEGSMADKFIKMSVNLPTAAVKVLRALAANRRTTMTEVLRQAIGTEKFIDEVSNDKGKILIEDKQGRIRQLVFR